MLVRNTHVLGHFRLVHEARQLDIWWTVMANFKVPCVKRPSEPCYRLGSVTYFTSVKDDSRYLCHFSIHLFVHYTISGLFFPLFSICVIYRCTIYYDIISIFHWHNKDIKWNTLFGVRLWNNGMHCMSFYVLIMTSWNGNTFRMTRPLWRECTSHR